MEGTPLTTICKDKGLPSLSKVYGWCATDKDFAQRIMTARRLGSHTHLDRCITELENADSRNIGLVREKLIHYRWLASKLLGQIYGDKKEVQVDQKIEIKWNTDDDITYENEVKNVTNSGSTHAQT